MTNPLAVNFEVYRNYHSIAFSDGYVYEVWNNKVTRGDLNTVKDKLLSGYIYVYNGLDYDRFMIGAAIAGSNCLQLKTLSDGIIKGEVKKPYYLVDKQIKYIDLIATMPKEMDSGFKGGASLALCAARNNSYVITGLDLYLDQSIDDEKTCKIIRDYNLLNCLHTVNLIPVCREVLDVKQYLSEKYNKDFLSSTFQQIAETIVREVLGIDKVYYDGRDVEVIYNKPNTVLNNIEIPPYIYNATVRNKAATYPKIEIAGKTYAMGSGGLHSTESSQVFENDPDYEIVDFDVTSYYPSIIEKYRPSFFYDKSGKIIDILIDWKNTRVEAKRSKDKLKDLSYKLLILAMFGKMGSEYSIFFSPVGFRFITLTGQLQLIDLIQAFEDNNIKVVSANTDGVVTRCHKSNLSVRAQVVSEWQDRTGMQLEATPYKAIYSQDVSNYIAVKADNSLKGKGIYADADYNPSSWKGDNLRVCVNAVKNYLTKGVPICDTIKVEKNIFNFLVFKRVRGGCYVEQSDEWVGRLARWYYPKENGSRLRVSKKHSKVPMSDNCLPAMDVRKISRNDINDAAYIDIATDWVSRIMPSFNKQTDLFL